MEGSPIKPIIKEELNKTEQNVEQFSSSEQDKNIQKIFEFSPELKNIAMEATKSDKSISLYRIENKNIEKEPDGITSHKDLKGQWFTPDLETAILYLRKSQQTFGAETERVEGVNLVVVKIPKEEFENLHVSKHQIASQMDVENDNYIVPENIERNYINLDDVQDKVGNLENLQKAKKQVKDKVEQFEAKEAIKLYGDYLKTIFPESKLQNVVYHGTNSSFDSFDKSYAGKGSGNETNIDLGFYFAFLPKTASLFTESVDHNKVGELLNKLGEEGREEDRLHVINQISGKTKPFHEDIYSTNKGTYSVKRYGTKNAKIIPVKLNIINPYIEQAVDFAMTFDPKKTPQELKEYTNLLKERSKDNDGIIVDTSIDSPFSEELNGDNYIIFKQEQIHILGSQKDIEQFKEFVSKSENKKDRQSIEEFLKESGIEKVPNIETHFFFNSHATTEDGQMVADRLDDKDIFIQENAGGDEERLKTWHKISKGEFTPEQAIENEKGRGKEFFWPEYFKAIFEKLQGTNKEILLVDIKSDSEIYNEIYDLMRKDGIYWNILDRSKSFEENCERIADVSELESITQKERENEILDNMKTSLLELLKEKPELQGKENLKILFSMGAFHTRLYHEMKKSGDNVSREIPSSSYTFNPRMAVERIIHFKGSEKAKEYMPKILLSFLLQRLNMKYDDISQKVLSRFSDEQTRELFEMYKKSESDDQFRNEAQTWIVEQFKKK